tara:strand:- start:400 stop:546 length:147 start_codon:yes stop_codon:yes gene_type:complete
MMTDNEMIEVIKSGTISTLSAADKAQVMVFAFGEDFIKSKDEGKVWKS